MPFQSLGVQNFRNLRDFHLKLPAKEYFLVGENGAGKSSFLEALYILSYGASFRERFAKNFIRQNKEPCRIGGELGAEYRVDVCYQPDGKKQIELDNKKIYDRKELLEISPCIVFAHGDIDYIIGTPKEKRTFIDQCISLVDISYVDTLRSYNKCLQERNYLLKNKERQVLLAYTEQLASLGWELQQKRARHFSQMSEFFAYYFNYVTNLEMQVQVVYQSSWRNCKKIEEVLQHLDENLEKDLHFGSTQFGPHRDLLQFEILSGDKKYDFVKFASTGQLRLASLALKSAQAAYLHKHNGRGNTLLLDDVLLEMDQTRRNLFLQILPPYEQIFFTFLPNEDLKAYSLHDAEVIYLEEGSLVEKLGSGA